MIARELEAGTFRLAWTQSASRSRWVVVKLGIVGLASMATAGLVSLMVTWWSSPIDRANLNVYAFFDERGIAPVGYAAFAFALGVTVGVLIRRTLPAMAATLAVFVAARLVITHWLRPHLVAPLHLTAAIDISTVGFARLNGGPLTLLTSGPNLPNAWIYSEEFIDKSGHAVASDVITNLCPKLASVGPPGAPGSAARHPSALPVPGGAQVALQNCAAKVAKTYHLVVTYQPSRHYWPMQWIELGIYLALALGLASFCYWWIRHRIA